MKPIPVYVEGDYQGKTLVVVCIVCGIVVAPRGTRKLSKKKQAQLHQQATGHRVELLDERQAYRKQGVC